MRNKIAVLALLFFVVSLNAGTISGLTSVNVDYTSASFPVSATLAFGPDGSWEGELTASDTFGNFVVDIPKIVLPKGAILDYGVVAVTSDDVTNQLIFGNGFLLINGIFATSPNAPQQTEGFGNWCGQGGGCSVPLTYNGTDSQIFGSYDVMFGTTTDPNGRGIPNSTLTISGETSFVINMTVYAAYHIDTPEPASFCYGFLGFGLVFLKLKYRRRSA